MSLRLLAKREWRDRYPSAWAGLGEALALLMTLSMYWYTARAFGSSIDYFSFVVIGEVVLLVPLCLVSGFLRSAREAQADGTLEALLVLPWSGSRAILSLGLASVPREILRAVATLAVAAAIFGFGIAWDRLPALLGAQLLALPTSIALGLLAVAIFLRFGRGESALSSLTAVAAVLAGAYFPVTVLPDSISSWTAYASPFGALMELSRAAISSDPASRARMAAPALALTAWSAAALPLGWFALSRSLSSARRMGRIGVAR